MNKLERKLSTPYYTYCSWMITFGLSDTLYTCKVLSKCVCFFFFKKGLRKKKTQKTQKWPRAKIWSSLVWFVLRYDLSLCTPWFVLQTVFGFSFLLSNSSVRPLWFHSIVGSVFKSIASYERSCSSIMEEKGVNGSWQSQEPSAVSIKDQELLGL